MTIAEKYGILCTGKENPSSKLNYERGPSNGGINDMVTKILVVDDDKNICDLLRMYLEKEGYEVKTASDGVEGVTAFRMYEPDLVLLTL